MAKGPFVFSFTETTLNVALAELLQKHELQSLGEAIIHRKSKGIGKKPDVLITINGIKVILEGKFDQPGAAQILEKQCIERIEDGICEICIGVVYGTLTAKTLTPTMKEVKDILKKAKYGANIYNVAPVEMEQLSFDSIGVSRSIPPGIKESGWQQVELDDLCSLVSASYTAVVTEDILGKAVTSFSNALQSAYAKLLSTGNAPLLADTMREIMEIPEATKDETDES